MNNHLTHVGGRPVEEVELQELKALAWDAERRLEQAQREIQALGQTIAQRIQAEGVVVEGGVPDENP